MGYTEYIDCSIPTAVLAVKYGFAPLRALTGLKHLWHDCAQTGVIVPFLLANSRAAFSEGSPFYIEKKIHLELKGEKDGIR